MVFAPQGRNLHATRCYTANVQRPTRISFKGMDPSPAIEAEIASKVSMLERHFGRTIGYDVVIEAPPHGSRRGHPFGVRLEISVPGGPPVVVSHTHHDREDHDDAYVAIRDAFNAAKRQLQDRTRKQRGEVKLHEGPMLARIWHLVPTERYGFLLADEGTEIYFHEHALVGSDYDELAIGDEVSYVMHDNEGAHGPQASTVKLEKERRRQHG
jgi:ribosome-associated translation inhibitor RaiA/cold shock CspA family protein